MKARDRMILWVGLGLVAVGGAIFSLSDRPGEADKKGAERPRSQVDPVTNVETLNLVPSPGDPQDRVLTEDQQRLLFERITGFQLPAHATDFNGRYFHNHVQIGREYHYSAMGFCTLPTEEAESLLAKLKESWERVGDNESDQLNYLTYHHEMPYELGPAWEGKFPVGFRSISLSYIDGSNMRRVVCLNPDTGRIKFYESDDVE